MIMLVLYFAKESDVKYVPCSGLAGENLMTASTVGAFNRWYSGPTLLEIIGYCNETLCDLVLLFILTHKCHSH